MQIMLPTKLRQLIDKATALGNAQAVQEHRSAEARKYASFVKRTISLGVLGFVAMAVLSAYKATFMAYLMFEGFTLAYAELMSLAPFMVAGGMTCLHLLWCTALYIRFDHEKMLWSEADDYRCIEANRLRRSSVWAAEMYRAIQETGRPLLMVDVMYLQVAASTEAAENLPSLVIAARKAWSTPTES